MTAKKIYIELDDLGKILDSIKTTGKKNYANDGEIKQVIDNIFFEIDKALIMFENNYQEKGEQNEQTK